MVVCVLDRILCSSRCLCFVCVLSVVPWFFDVFLPDFCLVCAYEGGALFV